MLADPTVFVVDDDPAFRRSARWLIESIGLKVKTYESAHEFLSDYNAEAPGCVVLDVRMPGMSGLDLQDWLVSRGIGIPVIIVTAHGDVPMAVRAMKAGAVHFFEKPFSDQLVLDQIQQAIAGDLRNRQRRSQFALIARRIETLTKREREVMELVVIGQSSKEIADKLGVSFKTIEAHRSKLMKKMQAHSVPQLIHMNLQQDPAQRVRPQGNP